MCPSSRAFSWLGESKGKGRSFVETDSSTGPPAVIVNEAFVRQYFKGEEPLGQHLTIGKGVMREFAAEPEREIIGVVGDTRDGGLNSNPQPTMYIRRRRCRTWPTR